MKAASIATLAIPLPWARSCERPSPNFPHVAFACSRDGVMACSRDGALLHGFAQWKASSPSA
eukprot:1105710-Pleurochrysis_carterae.AAC.1